MSVSNNLVRLEPPVVDGAEKTFWILRVVLGAYTESNRSLPQYESEGHLMEPNSYQRPLGIVVHGIASSLRVHHGVIYCRTRKNIPRRLQEIEPLILI